MAAPLTRRFNLLVLLSLLVSSVLADEKKGVTYDARSLIINGKRELLFSGSIHYPRSPPKLWPEILSKARRGGLNVIQTYVFWNIHEPVEGKLSFEGNYDLVKFIKLVQENDMYVILRVGPFIQAEWNHGGLPYWLREIPGIIFRSDNEPFKKYMKKYVKMIIDKMRNEKLFASQGGPIILSQIENEYDHIQLAYREKGASYVLWAGRLAHSLDTGVPWIMCKQKNAPEAVINTCNGRHCGDTFSGPNRPDKPILWTENWTAQYRVFGDPPSQRSAEDISFSVARFFSKNGCMLNYYMYYGGTNFGRTAAAFTTTRYYDEAPLDEFGLEREPKWNHLRDTHTAINLSKKALLGGTSSTQRVGEFGEIRIYENREQNACSAFLTNNHTKKATKMKFRGDEYYLPPRSISILPDCRTVALNTQMIVSQHNSRNFVKSNAAGKLKWKRYTEPIPTGKEFPPNSKVPLELYTLLKDTSDYAWFTTRLELGPRDMPFKDGILPVLRVTSLGHAMLAFINGEYIGSKHGSHEEKSFVFEKAVSFKIGINNITLLGITVGLPDSGAYMEHRYAGPRAITILGLNTGTIDLTIHGWGHKVGLTGEKLEVFTKDGAEKVKWIENNGKTPALTWLQSTFNAPEGNQPVAIKMTNMGKGMIWVNGNSIGRHWMSYKSPLGSPTQAEYHIPREFLKKNDNFLVVLEEEPSNPANIEILVVNRDTICTYVTEFHPRHVLSFSTKNNEIQTAKKYKPEGVITCPNSKRIAAVEFSSFGDPYGACGSFIVGTCDAPSSKEVVEKICIGKTSCTIPVDTGVFKFKGESCQGVKALAVQVKCG